MKRLLSLAAVFAASPIFASTSAVSLSSEAHKEMTFSHFLPFIIIIALFYVMLYLPHRKRQKQQRELMNNLDKGSEVSTTSGLVGIVKKMEGGLMDVEIAKGVVVKMQQDAVVQILPKGTVKF